MKEGKYSTQYYIMKERNLYDTCLRKKAGSQYSLMKEGKYSIRYSIMKVRKQAYNTR